jgi:hypothetical protein
LLLLLLVLLVLLLLLLLLLVMLLPHWMLWPRHPWLVVVLLLLLLWRSLRLQSPRSCREEREVNRWERKL